MIRKYFLIVGAFALVAAGCHNNSTNPPAAAPTHFAVTALAANNASYGAANVDTNLRDTWGLAFNTKAGYAWTANRASGTTAILNANGVPQPILYHINGPGGITGGPTGIVWDSAATHFPVDGTTVAWLFSQLNGTLAVVLPGSVFDSTVIVADRSTSSSFTGLALASGSSGPHLYVPNIRNGSLDAFDPTYTRTQFSSGVVAGFTPFNATVIDTQMFVTEAKMVTLSGNIPFVGVGPGNGGYVDVYDMNGNFERHLISGDSLDSPWGVAIAPSNFGSFSNDLLVGNFGDGTIHAYNRSTGAFVGTLTDANNNPIVINGLWALVVYNGTLYYTAGPNGGADGEFGTIAVH